MERAARTVEVAMNVLREVRINWQAALNESKYQSTYRKLS
jgi:hypothetical protein